MPPALDGLYPPLKPDGGQHGFRRDADGSLTFKGKAQPVGKQVTCPARGKKKGQRKILVSLA